MNARGDLIAETVWAKELTPDELERARRGISERAYAKGAYVFHRDDKLDYWTGVVSGLVKISTISASGKAMTFAGVGAGGWFGEGSVLKDETRKYDLVALRETRLALLGRPTFTWPGDTSTGFNRCRRRPLNERMGQFIATIEYDRILGPKARVARNLSWLFNKVLYPAMRTEIEISQEELGLLAGVSRPVVNKALQELEDEGLLRVEHGRITVFDLEKLSRFGPD